MAHSSPLRGSRARGLFIVVCMASVTAAALVGDLWASFLLPPGQWTIGLVTAPSGLIFGLGTAIAAVRWARSRPGHAARLPSIALLYVVGVAAASAGIQLVHTGTMGQVVFILVTVPLTFPLLLPAAPVLLAEKWSYASLWLSALAAVAPLALLLRMGSRTKPA